MSLFKGSNYLVRCVDCVNFTGSHCSLKKSKVSPKKKRTCDIYAFKGEYHNRTPAEATYVPYVDPGTRKLIKKLARLGVLSNYEHPVHPRQFKTTANSDTLKMGEAVRLGEAAIIPDLPQEEETIIWTPNNNED